ncbi:MAG: hypothetical protein HOP17_00830 [Acidobacteria bacterium]|nr:hypothetical protein [Acidobacteriota bacterium]
MKTFQILIFVCLFSVLCDAQWVKQDVKTSASLRGLSVVNEKVVWASGTGGTVIKTTDGGSTWKVMTVPGAEKLDFRDIEAFDANTAYILSIGNGESSRIYKTTDGGSTWKEQFRNKNEKAFFDAIACWDAKNCIAMSDPVDGRFLLIETKNGENWSVMDTSKMPPVKEGEAAFAASGTCLITQGKNNAFLVSGGTDARVFRTNNRGKTWQVSDTPITKGTAGSGIFSIAMFDEKNGVIVGGNYENPEERNETFAMTRDGGATWQPGARPLGYRSGVAYLDRKTVVAVGTNGSDVSYDRADTWSMVGNENLNAVAANGRNAVWSVGPNGVVVRLDSKVLAAQYEDPDLKRLPGCHLCDVIAIELGHLMIATKCGPSDQECSSDRRIEVRTTAVQIDEPHEYLYQVTAGKIVGDGPNVIWDLSDAKPGKYPITAGITVPYLGGNRWGVVGRTMTREVVVR